MTSDEKKEETKKKDVTLLLQYIKLEDIKWFAAGIASIIIVTGSAVIGFQAWADDKIDKKVSPVRQQAIDDKKEVKEEISKLRIQLEEAEKDRKYEGRRQDRRWEALLVKMKVEDPAPPHDGGGK